MPIERLKVDGLAELAREVLRIGTTLGPGRFLWFRGQGCQEFTLLPKLMREGKNPEQIFEREMRLLTRFRQRSMAYWPAGYPQDDWEHLFAMQHFGMPTRLLDWSENAFVACHFALGSHTHPNQNPCQPVVWCIDPIEWNRATPFLSEFGDSVSVMTTADDELEAYSPATKRLRKRSPIAMFGAHNSGRIVAQRGTFMIWGNEVESLETIAAGSTARLWRLEIMGDRSSHADALRMLGFGETMVFPELPSLASELSRAEGWRL